MNLLFNLFKKYYLAVSFLVVAIVVLLITVFSARGNSVNAQDINDELVNECVCDCNNTDDVLVDIKGAVKKPGVYKLSSSSIVNDVIVLAGGLNKNASTDDINLSKAVYNEMVIYVSTKEEIKNKNNSTVIQSNNDSNIDNECVPSNKVNINTATLNELQNINGIGEAKAQKILEYRNTNGSFKSIEDIKNVSGIGEAFYEKIKGYITV